MSARVASRPSSAHKFFAARFWRTFNLVFYLFKSVRVEESSARALFLCKKAAVRAGRLPCPHGSIYSLLQGQALYIPAGIGEVGVAAVHGEPLY